MSTRDSAQTFDRSGGVDVQGEGIHIGGDVVGRDKIVNTTVYGAIIHEAPREPMIKRRDAKPQPPRVPLDFFNRTGELAQVEQLIKQGKPVAICGSDGVGKSALLRQAANSAVARALPDGVILLEGLDEYGHALLPGDVIQRWFDAFYLSEPALKVNSASALPYLSQLRPLLLLDHVTLDPDQLRPLLDLFPTSPALIASLAALPGLARSIMLGPLPHGDSIELFAATSGLLINDAQQAAVDAICALLNDVPLAIVRAADVIREMNLPLEQAQARLASAPTEAGDNVAIGLRRAAALIQSVLTPLEEQVLSVAANLPGISIDPQTIANLVSGQLTPAVSGQVQVEGEWIIIGGVRVPRRGALVEKPQPAAAPAVASIEAAIEHLKALGLLHANSPRVRLDDGLREFWQSAGNGRTVKDRLLAQLLLDQINGRFNNDAYCTNEIGQVLGAIEHAAHTQQWTAAITLSRAIDPYVTQRGLWDAWEQIAKRVLQGAQVVGDRSAEGWALHQLGTRAIESNKAQAIDLLKQALGVRQTTGETAAAAATQHNLDVLMPPPTIPPKTGEGTIEPGGMSGLAKIVIGLLILAAAATGVYLATRPSITPPLIADTPVAQVFTQIPQPVQTFTPHPATHTHTPARTSTATPSPTATFTPTPSVRPQLYGAVHGQVLAGGRAMPRARVQLSDMQQQSQRFFTTTNADGSYQADQIPVGVYRVEAQTGWGWSESIQVQVMPDQIAAGDLIVITPIDQKAQALGSDFLGKPLGAEQIAADDAGRFREFERAVIYWRPDLGAHEIHGDIRSQWEILGGLLKNKLGYPVTDELPMSDRRGRYNDFESGGIYWTRDTGAHELRDRIREAWLNKYRSELGYPITDQRESPDRRQVFNIFEKGCMAWNPTTDEISINLGQYDPKSTDCAPIITIF